MTTDRPYRRALSQEEALRRLRAGSGRQWDPELAALFCTLIEHDQLKLSMPPLYPDELEKYLL
jgi:putative two-component system response regulator